MRENRPYGSEGGVGESRSRPLSDARVAGTAAWIPGSRKSAPRNDGPAHAATFTPNRRAAFAPMIFSFSCADSAQDSTNSIGLGSPTG